MRIDDDAFGRPALHRAKLWKMEISATHSSQAALASEARVHPSVGRFVNAVREARDAKLEYPVIIEPLPQDDGGGFVALVPDLPGCTSDGETAQAALASVMDAVDAWIDEAKALGRPIPPPSRHLVVAE